MDPPILSKGILCPYMNISHNAIAKRIETVMSVENRNNPIQHNCNDCNKEVELVEFFNQTFNTF